MSALLLDGRALARRLRAELHLAASSVAAERARPAHLALVLVGDDPSARFYAAQVRRACAEIGVDVTLATYEASITETALRAEVAALGARADLDGITVLLPLPSHLRERVITEVLPPEKDVDGLGPRNAGYLMLGFPSYVPSTADAALELLKGADIPLRGQSAVVVGRSSYAAKPTALLLLRAEATTTICLVDTPNLADLTRQADILVAATARPHAITGEMVRPGAVVVDAGLNAVGGTVVGDVDTVSVSEVAGYLTPVPGGLGPLTPLMLIRHTLIGPT